MFGKKSISLNPIIEPKKEIVQKILAHEEAIFEGPQEFIDNLCDKIN